jgi:mono/diheme cytochrome c family protein
MNSFLLMRCCPAGCGPLVAAVLVFLSTMGLGNCEPPVGPVIPGLHGKHPLDERQRGELLIGELRCAACHEGMPAGHMKEAPKLQHAGSRLTPDFIKRFIADPAAVQPGTTMPDLFGGQSAERRQATAESIAAYLLSLKDEAPAGLSAGAASPEVGRKLFNEVGCVACHSPRDEQGREAGVAGMVSLAHVAGKYQPGALAAFLHAPLQVRTSGRMPDMKLGKEEAAAIAAHLDEGPVTDLAQRPANADRIQAGRRAFLEFNCTACHQPEERSLSPHMPGPPLGALDLARGCLSDAPGSAPNFQLSTAQRQSIRRALAEPSEESSPTERIGLHLTRMNCIACHVRDDFGGVRPELDGYFQSSEESLGNESRIPPPLTLIGAKLRPEWLNQVLYDGRAIRPYMKTRMPLFGEAGVAELPGLFAEVDHLPPIELPGPDQESETPLRAGALLLLGDRGLNCIACHNYNGKESPGMKGLDLMTSYQRLQPAWFYQFMKQPAAFRPGIIMPSYWPDGEALQTEVLGGDTDLQLRALWHKFSLGHSARDPSGLRSQPSILVVTDEVRTYRGRSGVAGYRGIAVGFPGGLNYAFNAQNGALSAIWKGGFVNVGWQGQGAGNFNPLSRPVQLAQDVAFLQLPDRAAPWPLLPKTTQEQPVNPDPLYPRNHGYAFLGYSLDAAFIPTFRYRCGPVEINDRTVVSGVDGTQLLRRTFSFSTPTQEIVWFRALTGAIESETKHAFKTADLRLTIAAGSPVLRPAPDGGEELLIELSLPPGESTITVDYELLR